MTGDTSKLTEWAAQLEFPSDHTTFFNFLASHDGIGVTPARGILSEEEIDFMVETVKSHGGVVSYKDNGDGTQSAYELNISFMDAICHPEESDQVRVSKFIAAQSILLSLRGVPGIYAHSILGSRNDYAGLESSGINRRINREKLERGKLESELQDPTSLRHQVFNAYKHLIQVRRENKAFHPNAPQDVLRLETGVFALVRGTGADKILCLVNTEDKSKELRIDFPEIGFPGELRDLLADEEINSTVLELKPYQVAWIKSA